MLAYRMRRVGVYLAPALVLFVLFAGLAAHGANNAILAPIFSSFLIIVCAGFCMRISAGRLTHLVRMHLVSLLGAIGFICWTIFGATSLSALLAHPFWRQFGLDGATLSIAPHRALEAVVSFLAPMAAFAIGAMLCRGHEERDRLGQLFPIFTIGFGAFAFLRWWNLAGEPVHRLQANMGSANAAALTFSILGFVCLAQLVRSVRKSRDHAAWYAPFSSAPISLLAIIVAAACLYLTASRGGLASAALAMALLVAGLLWIGRRSEGATSPGVAVAAGVILLLGLTGIAYVFNRLDSFEADVVARAALRDAHWRAFLDRPWLGHGVNTFHELNAHYATPDTFNVLNSNGSAHNIYVQALEEGGVIGFVLLALTLGPSIFTAARTLVMRASGGEWAGAALAACCAALLHGAVDFGLQVPAIAALLAFLLGAFARNVR